MGFKVSGIFYCENSMILHGNKLLILPPKTGSRTIADVLLKDHSYHARHEPLCSYHLSLRIQHAKKQHGNLKFYCMIRHPRQWYESIYYHRTRQAFPINHVLQHHQESVTPFKEALHDYIHAPFNDEILERYKEDLRQKQYVRKKLNPMQSKLVYVSEHTALLHPPPYIFLLQREWNVGEYTAWIKSSIVDDLDFPMWNEDVKFILIGDYNALEKEGFPIDKQEEDIHIGKGNYKRPDWDDEMMGWLETYDLPIWKKISDQLIRKER